jgi:hypothetical protein
MGLVVKRLPIDQKWVKKAACVGESPDLWDLDTTEWYKGRRICIYDCPVREDCLRTALQAEGGTVGVVAGAQKFDVYQQRKKRSQCLLCGYYVATLRMSEDKKRLKSICWVCRRFAPCLNQCGRMVKREPGLDSYYCSYCAN